MNQPQFHPKARAEFEKSALFYDGKFPGLGLEFAAEVQAAVAFRLRIQKQMRLLQMDSAA